MGPKPNLGSLKFSYPKPEAILFAIYPYIMVIGMKLLNSNPVSLVDGGYRNFQKQGARKQAPIYDDLYHKASDKGPPMYENSGVSGSAILAVAKGASKSVYVLLNGFGSRYGTDFPEFRNSEP